MTICIYSRVSCEAIPEEMAGMGTTPPSCENSGDPLAGLRSQRPYLGAPQTTQTTTSSNTVPPSPTIAQVLKYLYYYNLEISLPLLMQIISQGYLLFLGSIKFFDSTEQSFFNSRLNYKTTPISDTSLLSLV